MSARPDLRDCPVVEAQVVNESMPGVFDPATKKPEPVVAPKPPKAEAKKDEEEKA